MNYLNNKNNITLSMSWVGTTRTNAATIIIALELCASLSASFWKSLSFYSCRIIVQSKYISQKISNSYIRTYLLFTIVTYNVLFICGNTDFMIWSSVVECNNIDTFLCIISNLRCHVYGMIQCTVYVIHVLLNLHFREGWVIP